MPSALSSGPRVTSAMSSSGGLSRGVDKRRIAVSSAEQAAADWTAICAMPQLVGYWSPLSCSVQATGSPISIVPDLSEKDAGGSELMPVTWAANDANATVTFSGGELTITSLTTSSMAMAKSAAIACTAGKLYSLTFTIDQVSAGIIPRFWILNAGAVGVPILPAVDAFYSLGTYTINFVPDGNTFLYPFITPTAIGQSLKLKNFSLRQVSSHPGVQTTTANKPILRQTPNTKQYWLDGDYADALNITLAAQLTNAAIFRVTAEGVTVARTQTVGTTYNIITPYAYNGPVAIFDESSTALTTNQVAQITRFMSASVPSLGPELIVNGGFSGATDLFSTNNSSKSIASGRLAFTSLAAGVYGGSYPSNTVTVGKSYLSAYRQTVPSPGYHTWWYNCGYEIPNPPVDGTLVKSVVTAAIISPFSTYNAAQAQGEVYYIDDVSTKEII